VKLAMITLLLVGTARAADIPLSNLIFTNANGSQPPTTAPLPSR